MASKISPLSTASLYPKQKSSLHRSSTSKGRLKKPATNTTTVEKRPSLDKTPVLAKEGLVPVKPQEESSWSFFHYLPSWESCTKAYEKTAAFLSPVVTKMQAAWEYRAVRIPVKAAASYLVPGGIIMNGATASVSVWSELNPSVKKSVKNAAIASIPKPYREKVKQTVIAAAKGVNAKAEELREDYNTLRKTHSDLGKDKKPISVLGRRWQKESIPLPQDPYKDLSHLRRKISAFEKNAKDLPLGGSPPVLSSKESGKTEKTDSGAKIEPPPQDLDASGAKAPEKVVDKKEVTNKRLDNLSENLSLFGTLYYMYGSICQIKGDRSRLYQMIKEVAGRKSSSLWSLFMESFGEEISWFQKVRCAIFYIFTYKTSIIQKTTHAYLKELLSEMRSQLNENRSAENRTSLVGKIVTNADSLFDVFTGAFETYAKDKRRKGNCDEYIAAALNELPQKKTLEELSLEFSHSLADHLSPKINFRFFNWPLNPLIKWAMRKWILPNALSSVVKEGIHSTEKHNIPFFLALTNTLIEQVTKLREKLSTPSDTVEPLPPPLPGTEKLSGTVKKIINATEIATCHTPSEIRAKLKKFDEREEEVEEDVLDGKIRKSIEEGLLKASHVLLHYLADPKNTEDLFSQLFDLMNAAFVADLPKTEEQWGEKNNELTKLATELKNMSKSLFEKIVEEAVEEEVRGIPPEKAELLAKETFKQEKKSAENTFQALHEYSTKLIDKINRQSLDAHSNIFPDLTAMTERLKLFENQEKLEQELQPLREADREGILRTLMPIFQQSNEVMALILDLQHQQKLFLNHKTVSEDLTTVITALEEISKNPNAGFSAQIQAIEEAALRMETVFPSSPPFIETLKKEVKELRDLEEKIAQEIKRLSALYNLIPEHGSKNLGLVEQLQLCIQGQPPKGVKKSDLIVRLRREIEAIFPSKDNAEEKRALLFKIENLNKYNTFAPPRPDLSMICREIQQRIAEIQGSLQGSIASLRDTLRPKLEMLADLSVKKQKVYADKREENLKNIQSQSKELAKKAKKLKKGAKQAQREAQLQFSPEKLKEIAKAGGRMGATATSVASSAIFGPLLGWLLSPLMPTVGPYIGKFIGGALGPYIGSAIHKTADHVVNNVKELSDTIPAAYKKKGSWGVAKATILKAEPTFDSLTIGAGIGAASMVAKALDPTDGLLQPLTEIGAAVYAGNEGAKAERAIDVIEEGIAMGKKEVLPKVMKIFDSAYDNLLSSKHIYNGALRLALAEWIASYPPVK